MLLETVTELATAAGRITLQHFNKDIAVETKPDESPVTVADRASEEFLRTEILRRFPDDTIIGEEFGRSAPGKSGRCWILDPIDGTRSFIRGVPLYGVMIGVEQDKEVVAGAVCIPALAETVAAEKGRGCWWNGAPARVSTVDNFAAALLLTTDYANIARFGKTAKWAPLEQHAGLVRTWGDCYGHILVATGRAEIMFDPALAIWDAAPLKIILEEAGGIFVDLDGNPTIHGGCGVSVNAALAPQVLKLMGAARP